MRKKDYIQCARAALKDFTDQGVPLTTSVKHAVEERRLNDDQARRLVEFTNTIAHLNAFDKQAGDKYIAFDLVDPRNVICSAPAFEAEKTAAVVDIKRVRRGTGLNGERRAPAIDVIDGELVGTAIGTVVEGDLPVARREGRRRRSILSPDAQVVFLQADRVKAKAFTVHTVHAGADRTVDDQIVQDHLVGAGNGSA